MTLSPTSHHLIETSLSSPPQPAEGHQLGKMPTQVFELSKNAKIPRFSPLLSKMIQADLHYDD